MDCSQIFIITGLGINTLASLIMLFPYLKITKNVDDDYILNMDKNGNYTQKKHKKDQRLGFFGFMLFVIGFIFQIIGTFNL